MRMHSLCIYFVLIGNADDYPNRHREVVQRAKGYGFIAQDAGSADLFAHFRDIEGSGFKTLQENQRVQFEVKQGQKGLQAANIKPL